MRRASRSVRLSAHDIPVSGMTVLIVLLATGSLVQPRTRDLAEPEAEGLVVAAVGPKIRSLPAFGVEVIHLDWPLLKDYYTFDVTYSNPGGSGVFGHFAVHKVSGDVWEHIFCKKQDSGELRRAQQKARQRIRLTVAELRSFADSVPCYRAP